MRPLRIGSASAFQAEGVGSIPTGRSNRGSAYMIRGIPSLLVGAGGRVKNFTFFQKTIDNRYYLLYNRNMERR